MLIKISLIYILYFQILSNLEIVEPAIIKFPAGEIRYFDSVSFYVCNIQPSKRPTDFPISSFFNGIPIINIPIQLVQYFTNINIDKIFSTQMKTETDIDRSINQLRSTPTAKVVKELVPEIYDKIEMKDNVYNPIVMVSWNGTVYQIIFAYPKCLYVCNYANISAYFFLPTVRKVTDIYQKEIFEAEILPSLFTYNNKGIMIAELNGGIDVLSNSIIEFSKDVIIDQNKVKVNAKTKIWNIKTTRFISTNSLPSDLHDEESKNYRKISKDDFNNHLAYDIFEDMLIFTVGFGVKIYAYTQSNRRLLNCTVGEICIYNIEPNTVIYAEFNNSKEIHINSNIETYISMNYYSVYISTGANNISFLNNIDFNYDWWYDMTQRFYAISAYIGIAVILIVLIVLIILSSSLCTYIKTICAPLTCLIRCCRKSTNKNRDIPLETISRRQIYQPLTTTV